MITVFEDLLFLSCELSRVSGKLKVIEMKTPFLRLMYITWKYKLNCFSQLKFQERQDSLLQILSDFIEGNKSISVCELQSVLNVYQLTPFANFAEHVIITPFEVVSNLKHV